VIYAPSAADFPSFGPEGDGAYPRSRLADNNRRSSPSFGSVGMSAPTVAPRVSNTALICAVSDPESEIPDQAAGTG
jgi:hypothetical protein